ncbi:MAG: hypothetical protein LBD10_09070 [Desulfobulbus sp.]|jgi:hypothetical protein|uniref:hypothetical protein n=1 Tax=Desulfobulbus sp. TaxID=895 RepID=UPI00284D7DE8|nr:hypothetical protein [Desulfobulbus sp.]MDR2550333.1 hypothetical protein [Desulfobulbus sp.]
MYLARKETGPRQYQYVLRESYRSGGVFYSREVAELGPDPGRCLVYPNESSFHLDEEFLRRLRERGVTASYTELEDLFFPFVDPYIKNRLQPFRQRHRYRNWQPANQSLLARTMAETQAMDRRRIHFLRLGRTSAETVDKTLAMYTVLLDKSRDEIEQMILERELALLPREYQSYLFTIFDLQRFFRESYARSIPQALDRQQQDAVFVEEICRLAEDAAFWQGFPRGSRLPYPLIRYLIMYFDTLPEEPVSWANFGNSARAGRFHRRPTAPSATVSRSQAFAIFGLDAEQLATMRKQDLTRLYRQKALELHPDKGGDPEQFIHLTAAYEELLPSLKS